MTTTGGGRDNRQAVRITSRILFSCREIDKSVFGRVLEDYNKGISPYNREELADIQVYIGAQSALEAIKERDSDLGAFLQHLDGKINLLLKKVDKKSSLMDTLTLQEVNIGANGLAFWGEEPVAPEGMVEIYMVLPPEHVFLACFGSVVDCNKEKTSQGDRYRVSVRFELITEADRETLVQYNFKQQSLALKRRRLQKEQQEG